jgi:hypothetical protein
VWSPNRVNFRGREQGLSSEHGSQYVSAGTKRDFSGGMTIQVAPREVLAIVVDRAAVAGSG